MRASQNHKDDLSLSLFHCLLLPPLLSPHPFRMLYPQDPRALQGSFEQGGPFTPPALFQYSQVHETLQQDASSLVQGQLRPRQQGV